MTEIYPQNLNQTHGAYDWLEDLRPEDFHFENEQILRPLSDAVFKALFMHRKGLTLALIRDFFDFGREIVDLTFLSTELPPERDGAKSSRLDVCVVLDDGTLVDVEMQVALKAGLLRRSVLYNAKLLAAQTKSGSKHSESRGVSRLHLPELLNQEKTSSHQPNVVSLTILNDIVFHGRPTKFRHTFELMDGDDYLDKGCFRLDFIELPKLRGGLQNVPEAQVRWIRFLLAKTFGELGELSARDAIIQEACEVLKMVSKDQKTWDLARARWEGEFALRNAEAITRKKHADELAAERRAREAAEAQAEAAQAQAEAAQAELTRALSKAVQVLSRSGFSSEQIANQLGISVEDVAKILAISE